MTPDDFIARWADATGVSGQELQALLHVYALSGSPLVERFTALSAVHGDEAAVDVLAALVGFRDVAGAAVPLSLGAVRGMFNLLTAGGDAAGSRAARLQLLAACLCGTDPEGQEAAEQIFGFLDKDEVDDKVMKGFLWFAGTLRDIEATKKRTDLL